MMQPYKKLKIDSSVTLDPFDDEDDWNDDDAILQLVANEIPSSSQMSQAIKATPINGHSTPNKAAGSNSKSRSFVFKRPSASASSVLSTRPTSYTTADTSALISAVNCTDNGAEATVTSVNGSTHLMQNGSTDNSTLDMQMADMVRKQHAHEGEIKWLRSTLQDKDTQINTIRTNFNAEKAKQKLQFSEKERGYVKDLESLRSELQFKESELISSTQALDRLKREKSKSTQPAMKLGQDGFPVSTSDICSVSSAVFKQVKSEPMEVVELQSVTERNADLRPADCNKLVPRKLVASEYRRKLLISDMLKARMEDVKNNLNSNGIGALRGHIDMRSKDKCLQLLSDCITCAKDLCYL